MAPSGIHVPLPSRGLRNVTVDVGMRQQLTPTEPQNEGLATTQFVEGDQGPASLPWALLFL